MVRNSALGVSGYEDSEIDGCPVHCIPGKSMVPLLSASTSFIISCSSDSEGFCPSDLMTVPSSFVVICPDSYAYMSALVILLHCNMLFGKAVSAARLGYWELTIAIFVLQVEVMSARISEWRL